MAAKPLPDIETLNKLLICDANVGTLRWRARPLSDFRTSNAGAAWNGRYADRPAFQIRTPLGYLYGEILGKRHFAHRVIWKMATGEEPDTIDHINGDPLDNRLVNLRAVDRQTNMRNRKLPANNTSGAHGVDRWNGRWRARLNHGGRTHHIGMFDTFDAAVEARKEAAQALGFSPRHG